MLPEASGKSVRRHFFDVKVFNPFTPIVGSAFGGFGIETNIFISKLIEKLAEKKGDERSVVANYVRSKIKSQIACIRGSRNRKRMVVDVQQMDIVTNASTIAE